MSKNQFPTRVGECGGCVYPFFLKAIISFPSLIKLKEILKHVNTYDSFNSDHFGFVITFNLNYMLK